MKFPFHYILIFFIGFLAHLEVKSQCVVSAGANLIEVECGSQVDLTALSGNPVLSTNFNNFQNGIGWSSNTTVIYNNPCLPSHDGNASAWVGNTTAFPRELVTDAFDVACGGTISFWQAYATQGGNAPCEGPDLPGEGVDLQYSNNNGPWISINYIDPNGGYDPLLTSWQYYTFNIPAGAYGTNTRFRWYQNVTSGSPYDHWGIDDVSISTFSCNANYDWSNLPSNNDPQNQTVTIYSDTTFQVIYTDGVNVCSDDITIQILEPTIDVTASDTNLDCGQSTTLDVTASSVNNTPTCGFLLYTNDTYGDGWNGGSLQILVNGQLYGTYNAVGLGSNYNLTFNDNDVIELIYSSGAWDYENEYQLFDNFGNLIFQDGQSNSYPNTGNVFSYVVNCGTQGVSNYSFNWIHSGETAQTISVAPNQTQYYSVEVMNSYGCIYKDSIEIITSPIFNVQETIVNASCNGINDGVIDLFLPTPSNYQFSWSNGSSTEDITNLSSGIYSVTITDINNCSRDEVYTISEPTALSLTESIVDANCNGSSDASISLLPNGGVPPYFYAWSSGDTSQSLSSITAGSYDAIITDANGCIINTPNYTISEPTALSLTESIVDANCNGSSDASISLLPNGGVPPYFYAWSNGQTTQSLSSITAGSYDAIITDANGCIINTPNYTISEPTALSLTESIIDANCNGSSDASISLLPNGGVPPYFYAWSNGQTTQSLSSITAGSYDAIITDANGCIINTPNYTISEPTALSLTESIIDANCNGSSDASISLLPNGGVPPYFYAWSNGQTTQSLSSITAGSYDAIITDANGCIINTPNYTISEPTALSLTESIIDANCNGSSDASISLLPNGGVPPYFYAWSNGQTTQSLSSITAGSYDAIITDANGCIINTPNYTISEPTALSLTESIVDANCNGSSDASISLLPNGGVPPYFYAWSNGQTTQSLSSITAGSYDAIITDANGCIINTPNYTISEPTALSLTESIVDANCNGSSDASISLLPNGGVPPYFYAWSNGQTTQSLSSITAGSYDAIITDANGCVINTPNYTISEPTALSLTESIIDANCNGSSDASISLLPNGGVPPYFYAWSNGQTTQSLSSITAGSYDAIITDANGCISTHLIIQFQNLLLYLLQRVL